MTQLNAQDELTFIKNVIQESKTGLLNNFTPAIVWGIVISLGYLSTYILIEIAEYSFIMYAWIVFVGIGWIYTFFEMRGESRVKNFADQVITALWIGTGLTMTIFGFIGTTFGGIDGMHLCAVFASLLGTAYLTSGVIFEIKELKLMSYIWWLGSIVMFVFPGNHSNLIMAVMIIILQIAPALYAYKKFKAKKALENE